MPDVVDEVLTALAGWECFRTSSPSSDNRVQGVVEPLRRQFHHLSQRVVLYALVLVVRRLERVK